LGYAVIWEADAVPGTSTRTAFTNRKRGLSWRAGHVAALTLLGRLLGIDSW
jgi:hypothetical protein